MKIKKVLSIITSFAMVFSFGAYNNSLPITAKADEEYYEEDYTYDSWEEAFANKLWKFESDETFTGDSPRYETYDINADGTPELFVSSGEAHYSDLYVYAFIDGKIQLLDSVSGANGSAYVVSSKGYIYYKGGNQGSFWTQVKQFNGRELTEVALLEDTSAAVSASYYGYKYNGTTITQNQYNTYLTQYTSNSISGIGRKNGFDQIIINYNNMCYVNYLDYLALEGCVDSTVTSINIPASVNGIPVKTAYSPLSDRDSLTEINVDPQNPYFSSLDGVLYDKNKTKLIAFPSSKNINHFEIPQSVNTIGENAFLSAKYITSVTLPSTVDTICDYAFANTSLKSITIMNPNCYIEDNGYSDTINTDYDYNLDINYYDGIIKGYDNSTAQQYAEKYGLNFESLGPDPASTTTTTVQPMNTTVTTTSSEIVSGKCGDNLTYTIEGDTLTISGTGQMYDQPFSLKCYTERAVDKHPKIW